MLTKIRLSPSGPEIDTSTLLSALLDTGFIKGLPALVGPDVVAAGGTGNSDLAAAFVTTEPNQTVLVLFRFNIEEAAPGAAGDVIVVSPRLDNGPYSGAWITPVVKVAVAQSYQFAVLVLNVIAPGPHALGLHVDATAAGGDVGLSGDEGVGHTPSVMVFGARAA